MRPSKTSRVILALGIAAAALLAAHCDKKQRLAEQAGAAAAEAAPAAGGVWTSLFNGRDLEGWTPKFAGQEAGVNYKDTFRVEDGVLKVSYEGYEAFAGEFGHLFYKEPFGHYLLRVEYRFVGDQTTGGPSWGLRNSGVMFHSQPPESMGLAQSFPVSIEANSSAATGRTPGRRPTSARPGRTSSWPASWSRGIARTRRRTPTTGTAG